MKRVIYIFTAMAMVAVGVTSCYKPSGGEAPKPELPKNTVLLELDGSDADHGYGTRGNNTDPAYVPVDRTVYSVVSYPAIWGGTSSPSSFYWLTSGSRRLVGEYDNATLRPVPSILTWAYETTAGSYQGYGAYKWHLDPYAASHNNATNETTTAGKPKGRYAYIADPQYKGILQPCDVVETPGGPLYNDPVNTYDFDKRNPQSGQALWNTDFMTVFIYPAVNLQNIITPFDRIRGQERILISRVQKVTASEPFPVTINGYGIVLLPDTAKSLGVNERRIDMHDIRSKIIVNIIRDADLTQDFTITNIRLKDAGYWGWYHPMMQYTDISYYDAQVAPGVSGSDGYPRGKDWIYIGTQWGGHAFVPGTYFQRHIHDESIEPLITAGGSAYTGTSHIADFYDMAENPGDRLAGTTYYTTKEGENDGIYLFANDYKTGGYLSPSLLLNLNMGTDIRLPENLQNPDNITTFKMNIPMVMHFKPGYQYKFKMVVSSVAIRVTFQEKPWWVKEWGDPDLGIAPPEVELGTWIVNDWVNDQGGSGHDGNGDIGLMKRR